ncbi:hypothetical protein ABS71_16915 [bacterium SCN 62-11]|nr:hypothetical protein [Candidatus Eremiobacteraeota bacterium]ODT61447.1 MAG: hypothetical protein ABS71_16915 [bacterium SCN 62-11]
MPLTRLAQAAEELIAEMLAHPSQDKFSISPGATLKAWSGSLHVDPHAEFASWSGEFVHGLASFRNLSALLCEWFASSPLRLSRSAETHAEAVVHSALAHATQGTTLRRSQFSQYLLELVEASQRAEATFVLCRRLLGVELLGDSVDLSEPEANYRVGLHSLNDEELTARMPSLDTLQYGLISSDVATLQRVEVRVTRQERLREFDHLFKGPERWRSYLRETERVQEAVLLLKPEAQAELGTPFFLVARPNLGRCAASRLPRSSGPAIFPPTLIHPGELADLRRSFSVAQKAQDHPALRSALHRYALAGSRLRHEDRLVDLVIGFEAVLLQGLQNELSHRFSLNGSSLSHWIHKAPRQPSYHLFRSAYAARSALVHGYGPKVKLHRIESMSDELRHLLASFIQWLILESPDHGLQPRMQADDWLRILFDSPP